MGRCAALHSDKPESAAGSSASGCFLLTPERGQAKVYPTRSYVAVYHAARNRTFRRSAKGRTPPVCFSACRLRDTLPKLRSSDALPTFEASFLSLPARAGWEMSNGTSRARPRIQELPTTERRTEVRGQTRSQTTAGLGHLLLARREAACTRPRNGRPRHRQQAARLRHRQIKNR